MALRTPLSVTPHLYMGDSTGRPLDKGVVYFGEQDKDPEFYPINLFSDDALTKPLAQPVHTKGGYLYDKGDMVEPHAKELIYSVKVLDSYGRKVFYKGAMMRNSWNDDVIEQINTAIIGSADAARQVAIDITNDAINNTAVEGGVLADTFVTVTANGPGTVARSLRDVKSERISIKDFGAIGDGVTDDTISIQNALNSKGDIVFPKGEYLISVQGDATVSRYTYALKILSDTNITFEIGAKLILKPNDKERCMMLFLDMQDNITVRGLHLVGDRDGHLGTTGEQGHCIGIFGGENITFYDSTIEKAWGDGVYISSNYSKDPSKTPPRNVRFVNGFFNKNSRNGIAVIAVSGCLISGIEFRDTDRISPMAGVDVEPFTSSDKTNSPGVVENLIVRDCTAYGGNVGFMGAFNNTDITHNSLVFSDLHAENVSTGYVFAIKNEGDKVVGRNLSATNASRHGMSLPHLNAAGTMDIDSLNFINCNTETRADNAENSVIIVRNSSTRPYVMGNISITGVKIDSPNSNYAFYFSEQAGGINTYGATKNIKVSLDKLNKEVIPFYSYKVAFKHTGFDELVNYTFNSTTENSYTITPSSIRGLHLTYIGASDKRITYNLPNSGYIPTQELVFRVGEHPDMVVNPVSNEYIYINGIQVPGYLRSKASGSWVKLKARMSGGWDVVDSFGDWYSPELMVATTGSTEQRPTNATIGHQYFDTTIGKPIYWTGSTWVDASGSAV